MRRASYWRTIPDRISGALARGGPLPVKLLAIQIGRSESATCKHLKVLVAARLLGPTPALGGNVFIPCRRRLWGAMAPGIA
jgi:hypothetical protein